MFPILTYFLFGPFVASPQELPKSRPKIRAGRVNIAPTLDGLVNETVWQGIEPATNLIQQQPDEGAQATERTEVRFGYDNKYLYIGIICFDSSPADIVVNQNRRDGSLTDTDSIQILLDTFHDQNNAFIFGTSPTGSAYDAQVSKGGPGNTGAGRPPGSAQTGAQSDKQVGGDLKYNLTGLLTLDATFNTDFAQVEVDEQQTVDYTDPHDIDRTTLGRTLLIKYSYRFSF